MPVTFKTDDHADESFAPVSPIDVVQPQRHISTGFSQDFHQHTSSSEQPQGLNSPRTPRFTEATSVVSPIDQQSQSPFAEPPKMASSDANSSVPNVSDLGFGYVADNRASRHITMPQTPQGAALRSNPPASPLKSAMKTPGAQSRFANANANPLSPTFKEEQILEYHEKHTEKENAKDVKIKTRVRIAKFFLRCVNFSCSLIILALVGQSLVIFNATKNLAARNSMFPWAPNTPIWPQILVLTVASLSVALALAVFWGYARGGHKGAEKVGVYYTMLAVFIFTASIVIWVVAAATFQNARSSGDGKDLWGWACKEGERAEIFKHDVPYGLVCRLQDWVLICIIIEIIVDIMVISIYAVIFYRFYSKRKLRKSMNARDKARSDLYLAHLRSQTAPNTPGFPRSPMFPSSPTMKQDPYNSAENGQSFPTQYATVQAPSPALAASRSTFQLQAPPSRNAASRSPQQASTRSDSPPFSQHERVNNHMGAAPGEKQYEAVPIPGAYSSPMASPAFPPQQSQYQHQRTPSNRSNSSNEGLGVAMTTDEKVLEQRLSQ